jgi:SAM-dependent methyltransferase
MSALYDSIGINYAELRKPDPRIAKTIEQALGAAKVILNVGAGTGSYEPADRQLIAVEPSLEMIRKRRSSAARAIQASADDLPFEDGSFEASMAIVTMHHWPDKEAGLREMRRVTRGPIVLLTFDPSQRPWLTDYLRSSRRWMRRKCHGCPTTSDGWAMCVFRRCWCRTIAQTVSCMPIGEGPRPIWMRVFGQAALPFGRSGMPRPV